MQGTPGVYRTGEPWSLRTRADRVLGHRPLLRRFSPALARSARSAHRDPGWASEEALDGDIEGQGDPDESGEGARGPCLDPLDRARLKAGLLRELGLGQPLALAECPDVGAQLAENLLNPIVAHARQGGLKPGRKI